MNKSLIKYSLISYFFFVTLVIESEIMLNKDDKLIMPLPMPYDGIIYTAKDLNDFINETIKSDKQPTLIFGANWCPDCRIFSGTIDIPKINEFIETYFNILYIDVKRYEINMNLIEYFDIPAEEGIPRVLVFDFNKNIINKSSTTEWRTARDRSSQDIFNFFQEMKKSS